MSDSELTLFVLREIRDSIRTLDANLSSRIDTTNQRVDVTNQRIDRLAEVMTDRFDILTQRVSLLETAVKDAGGQLLMITRYLKNKTEVEVAELRERVTKLEAKVG